MLRFLLIYGVTAGTMGAVYYGLFPWTRRRLTQRYLEEEPLEPMRHLIPDQAPKDE